MKDKQAYPHGWRLWGKREQLKLETPEKSLAQQHHDPSTHGFPEALSILSPQQSQGSSHLLGSDPSLTVYCYGKPLARPCEVIQTRFVAMLECTNQELF